MGGGLIYTPSLVYTQCMQIAHMAKTAAISVRVEPALKAAIEAAAKADDRTLAQYVERVRLAHLKSAGGPAQRSKEST